MLHPNTYCLTIYIYILHMSEVRFMDITVYIPGELVYLAVTITMISIH